MDRYKTVGLILFMICRSVLAQTSTFADTNTIRLKTVDITSIRLNSFGAGTKINYTDSLTLNQHKDQNLADLLNDDSPLFIKSYGLGALSTCSFRGASADQTVVLWNGFNINSPMHGQSDLALLPLNFADEVAIQYGGSGALWGSGAVGGTIHLTNKAKFNKGLSVKINTSAASFETYSQSAAVELSRPKFVSVIKLLNISAKNNFKYDNQRSSNKVKIIQQNAELINYGLLTENYLLINAHQKINLFFWYQHTDRNIPSTMLQEHNQSKQIDNNYRLTSEWQCDRNKIATYIRAAYLNEAILYNDGYSPGMDSNRAQSVIAETETRIKLNSHHAINAGLNNTFVRAVSTGYQNKPQQNKTAVFLSYRFNTENEKLTANLSVREELIHQHLIPFTYDAGVNYRIVKYMLLQANIGKVYRLPTFNELYWIQGGNLQLLPETGYSGELGLQLSLKNSNNKMAFNTIPTVFNRNMKNWIIWLPAANYWTPQNVMEVWSRGIETNSTLSLNGKNIKISFTILTNYVVSTNQTAKTVNDAAIYKQLMYVPIYSGFGKIGLMYKNKFSFYYRHNYTGYRYTSSDNKEYLSPFYIGTCYLSYKKAFKNTDASIFLQLNNIWNQHYQAIKNRPMPEANFNAGLNFIFNKPNTTNN